jgi:spore maturation protein CgeB
VEIVDLGQLGSSISEAIKNLILKLDKDRPDFVLTVDHIFTMRERGFVPQLLTKMRLPHASWLTDNPFYCEWITKKSISPYCCLFVWDEAYVDKLREYGFQHVFHLPLATNPRIFKPLSLDNEDLNRYMCNISFCGTSFYPDYRKCILHERDPSKKSILEEILKRQCQYPTREIDKVIEEVQDRLGCKISFKEDKMQVRKTLEFASATLYRKEILEELWDLGVKVYGDSGWKYLIPKVNSIRWLDYHHELPKLYNAAKINLNMTLFQLKTTMTVRPFDIAACGAFTITDYRDGLKDLFNLDEEVVYYRNKRDLREKIEYFLKHPKERKIIAWKARRRVLEEHTYERRMSRLIDVMRRTYNL